MWGHINQRTIEINGNPGTQYGPSYDDRLNSTTVVNVIEIFNTMEELKTFLAKTYPGQNVKVFELTPMIANQVVTLDRVKPVLRGGSHG